LIFSEHSKASSFFDPAEQLNVRSGTDSSAHGGKGRGHWLLNKAIENNHRAKSNQ
jgi:hypothetical protein